MIWSVIESIDYTVITDETGQVLATMNNKEQATKIVKTHNETIKFLINLDYESSSRL